MTEGIEEELRKSRLVEPKFADEEPAKVIVQVDEADLPDDKGPAVDNGAILPILISPATSTIPTIKKSRSGRLGVGVIAIATLMLTPFVVSAGLMPIGILALVFLASVLSIVPSVIAVLRGCKQAGSIACVNIFSGWTCVGWIIALVWALKAPAADDSGESSLKAGCAISLVSLAMAVAGCVSPNLQGLSMLSFVLLSIVLPAHWGITNCRIHQVLGQKSSMHQVAAWEAFVASGIASNVLLVAGVGLANVSMLIAALFPAAQRMAAGGGPISGAYLSVALCLGIAALWGGVMLCALFQARVNYVLANAIVGKSRGLIAKLLPSAGFFAATVYAPFAIDGDKAVLSLSYISVWVSVAFFCGYFFTLPLLRHRQTRKELD